MKKLFALFCVVVALVGCSSGVKLDENSGVVDRSGSSLNGANSSAAGASSLTGRDIGTLRQGDQPGPAGVETVLYFDYDSSTIKPEYQAMLQAHARYLNADHARRVSIEGHTDQRGGSEYNLALGQKRSDAVRKALAALGVADEQLESVSYGKEKPAAVGSDEAAYAKNRRAEIAYR